MSTAPLDPKERLQLILKVIAWIQDQVGKEIHIEEDLSFDYANRRFDKHCTVTQVMQFVLENARPQSSGGHLDLRGHNARYGICTEVQELALDEQRAIVLQALSHDVWRQTTITVVDSQP